MKFIGQNDTYTTKMDKFNNFKDYVHERRRKLAKIIESTVNSNGQIDLELFLKLKVEQVDVLYKL